jgi:hypothetical protein
MGNARFPAELRRSRSRSATAASRRLRRSTGDDRRGGIRPSRSFDSGAKRWILTTTRDHRRIYPKSYAMDLRWAQTPARA